MGYGWQLGLRFLDSNDDAPTSSHLRPRQPTKVTGDVSLQKVISHIHYYLKFNLSKQLAALSMVALRSVVVGGLLRHPTRPPILIILLSVQVSSLLLNLQ